MSKTPRARGLMAVWSRPTAKRFALAAALFLMGLMALLAAVGPTSSIQVVGGCGEENPVYIKQHYNDGRMITYCAGGDAFIGNIETPYFLAGNAVAFSHVGYTLPTTGFYFVAETGEKQKITLENSGEWQIQSELVPPAMRGKQIKLVAEDNSPALLGWVGLGSVYTESHQLLWLAGHQMAWAFLFGLLVCFILVITLAWFLARLPAAQAIAAFMICIGSAAYAAFYVYAWGKSLVGGAFSALLMAGVLFLLASLIRKKKFVELKRAIWLLLPVFIFTALVIFIGYYPFLQGVDSNTFSETSWSISAGRWRDMPVDNWLPKLVADDIWNGGVKRPLIGDWLTSDRPPLQSGAVLLFYPIAPGNGFIYQIVSSIFQGLVLLPAWVLLVRITHARANRAVVMFALCASSLMAMHTLFVWPKLTAAAYIILFFLLLFPPEDSRASVRSLFGAGCAAGLAMMSHGGSFFALAGIALFYLLDRFLKISVLQFAKEVAVASAGLLVFMGPWQYFSMAVDPNYAFLMKMHLAGATVPSQTPLLDDILRAYSKITLLDWLNGRLLSLQNIFSREDLFFSDLSAALKNQSGFKQLLDTSFFYTAYSMWFLSLWFSFGGWVLSRFRSLKKDAWRLFVATLLGSAVWIILMFGPGQTLIHHGSLFNWLGLFIFSAVLLQTSSSILFNILAGLNFALFLRMYIFDKFFAGQPFSFVYFAMSTAFLAGLFFALRHIQAQDDNQQPATSNQPLT
ncbi:MAG TPA: hypothetical protein PL141_08660 [Thermoflexales bacterium]|nr:hypothetical protein [Thermoflexales bacterium]HQW36676.1 hypothetical protein [Thermoflexales bacterium]